MHVIIALVKNAESLRSFRVICQVFLGRERGHFLLETAFEDSRPRVSAKKRSHNSSIVESIFFFFVKPTKFSRADIAFFAV